MSKLDVLAQAYGVAVTYRGQSGPVRHTPASTKRWALATMGVTGNGKSIAQYLAEAPRPADTPKAPSSVQAFAPVWLRKRAWGMSCQLYALRSARDWGIGDLEDLARFAEVIAEAGGDFVGIGPLHALFLSDPRQISPYSPSNRRFLNPLYIAPDRLPGFAKYEKTVEAARRKLRAKPLVDYAGVARVKFSILEKLFADFMDHAARAERAKFDRFVRDAGDALPRYCLFEALSEHFKKRGIHSWRNWPAAYRDPDSPTCRRFAQGTAERMRYFAWLQWHADTQLATAQKRARVAGMRIGLYLDIAVGISPDGEAAWSEPETLAVEARLGAPPDPFNDKGQNWGLVPLSPQHLREQDGAALRAVLSGSMRHAGAVRIDHALGLWRLFWIPEGRDVRHGTYIRYPFETMTKAVAEESRVFRTIVIGEDLGAVPEGFSEALNGAGILSYRVLYFERGEKASFLPTSAYPPTALACISTQDLPTLAGWWTASDIRLRAKLGRTGKAGAAPFRERRAEKTALIEALQQARLWNAKQHLRLDRPISQALIVAVHRYLARSPSMLFAVQLEDALGLREQANLPGTIDEYPNWRRRMPVAIDDLAGHRLFRTVTKAVNRERGRR
jgi:4-alpha-glucanotransferase